jgi:intracellular multiplication protein IcmB
LTLVADDGSLVSAFILEGAYERVWRESRERIFSVLTDKTRVLLETPGHFIKVAFAYSPQAAQESLKAKFRPARASARAMGLNFSSLLGGWEEAIAKVTAEEKTYVALWTTPKLLAPAQGKKARETFDPARGLSGIPALRAGHRGALAALAEAFATAGLKADLLSAHALVRDVKAFLYGREVPLDWRPLLPGDPFAFVYPDSLEDASAYPSVKKQIFAKDCEILQREFVRAGDRIHAPFFLSLPPQNPLPFQELFRALGNLSPKLPLNMSFSLIPDGLGGMKAKSVLARILALTAVDNRRLIGAYEALSRLREEGETVVGLSFNFDAHVDLEDYPSREEALRALIRGRSELVKIVCGWGSAAVQEATGDPLLGVAAALPALLPRGGPAPRAAFPLKEAWSFTPLRPAAPWREGSLVLRSSDGKPMPLQANSSLQPAWIDLGIAPMGAGKSVLLNAINLAFCLQGGAQKLPWLSIIDVGPSSKGLIDLLREALPPGEKHLAAFKRLRLTPQCAVNPLDTPLGARFPYIAHANFLVNLLSLCATPLDAEGPPTGVGGLYRLALEGAYREAVTHPKLWTRDLNPELYDLAAEMGLTVDGESCAWEAVDFFFQKGLFHEAVLAQRHAVPTLADVAAEIRQNPSIKVTYAYKIPGTGEDARDYAWRCLAETVKNYPILAKPTRFSMGDARVMALDLDEVAPRGGGRGGDRQTAVMYMLARFLVGSRFFWTLADAAELPAGYREHHQELIGEIRLEPKRLCYDELHRVTQEPLIRAQLLGDLETCARESRKWNLSIGLYSQSVDDFPKVILELATNVFLLGAGTQDGKERLAALFGLNPDLADALGKIGKPGPAGASLVAILKTQGGASREVLVNTLSSELIWAFSSTAEDAAVRGALYARYGVSKTLSYLARQWPRGIKAEIERRKNANPDEAGAPDSSGGAVASLLREIYARLDG